MTHTLKQKLKNNELTLGTWITIGHPSIVEILATAGFEWMVIDLEHSPVSIETAQTLFACIQANNMAALARVSKNEEVVIKRVMDAGADGVIVPMIKTREEAEQAVAYVKYPPVGRRGVGLSRAQKYGIGFQEYVEWVNRESVVIAQIEHIQAVENLEAILSVEGIDGIIVGPYDLSASMGYPGQYHREDVKAALQRVIEVTRRMKKPLGFHVIESDPAEVESRIAQGYTLLAYSLDFFFLGDSARRGMQYLRAKTKEDNGE
ncbi:MAG: 2,4-dihydroxyhept-2-ene-1,7-dioic acid aldolase [Chitinophagales bacterium]|jgi:2-dehydro-3-deoxyglucarate aldolase|nr:MAG: 2,4-dihydroxyhept-2-ene-1,7-dioic acid aldolase [Chitinophagales bacterium]